ncbi:hypothetical protein AB8A28_19950 [Tardiphaga sp. 71_E8_N1_1]|uniref:hypothetical protein n=1 Tax=Tardiphaga sp. 71_E8_N1_1 TaxID=3240784 RepID=UPI003F8AB98D
MSKPSKVPRRFKVSEQEYRVVGTEGYYRGDRYIELHAIEAICAHPGCNRVFRAAATKTAINKRQVNRRCSWHKRPGSPVGDRPQRPKKRVRKSPVKLALLKAANKIRERNLGPRAPKPPERPSYLD